MPNLIYIASFFFLGNLAIVVYLIIVGGSRAGSDKVSTADAGMESPEQKGY